MSDAFLGGTNEGKKTRIIVPEQLGHDL